MKAEAMWWMPLAPILIGGMALAQREGQMRILPIIDEALDPPGTQAGFPDPYVLNVGDGYVITGTGTRLARTASFRRDDVELLDLEYDFAGEPAGQVWGLKLYQHTDGNWHGYGTLHYGWFKTAIAHFVPQAGEVWTDEHPITRWRVEGLLVGDVTRGWVAYDSNVVRDDEGTLWLLYNSGHPEEKLGVDIHVKARRMLDPARLDPSFEPRTILSPEGLRSEDRNPGYIQILEATHVQKVQEKWVLLYSAGDFDDGNYKIGVAYSDTLIPPEGVAYKKAIIDDANGVWENDPRKEEVYYLLQSQEPRWPNYCGRLVNGPGIGNLVRAADGTYELVFHARKPGITRLHGQGRYVWRMPLDVDISRDRPMHEWIRPRLSAPQ